MNDGTRPTTQSDVSTRVQQHSDALSRLTVDQLTSYENNDKLPDKVIANIKLGNDNTVDKNLSTLLARQTEIETSTMDDLILS